MSRMAQPSECILLELSHPFAAEAQLLPQFFQRAWRLLSQTIPADNHPAKTFGKLTDQSAQGSYGQFLIDFLSRVRHAP
jgi:hypothetical protein